MKLIHEDGTITELAYSKIKQHDHERDLFY